MTYNSKKKEVLIEELIGLQQTVNELENKVQDLERNRAFHLAIYRLFMLCSQKISRLEYIQSAIEMLHELTCCRCVGIRVISDEDALYCESYMGFSRELWESENWLSIVNNQYACIRIIPGKVETQDYSVVTPHGSFCCNNISNYVSKLPEAELLRFTCMQSGFKSIAIIPIFYHQEIIGVICLADEKIDMVPKEIIKKSESISSIIGESIYRIHLEDKLGKNRKYVELLVKEHAAELKVVNEQLKDKANESKLLEELLLKCENRFMSVFLQSPIGIELYDPNGRLININKACLDIFGINNVEDVIGFNLFEDPNVPYEAKGRLRNGEVVKYQAEFSFEIVKEMSLYDTANAGIKYIDVVIIPLVSQSGTHGGYLVQAQDINQRKLAEKALNDERQRLYSLMDRLPAFLCLQAPDFSIRFTNRYFKAQWGEPGKQKCYELLEGRNEPCNECRCLRVLDKGCSDTWEWSRFDGRTYKLYAYPFSGIDRSPLALVLGIDITEQKQMEQGIARLDMLNLVGEMAVGIGHEIRNPMTTVRGFLQMLAGKEECAKYKDYYELMIDELDRANSIITEFLSLAKNKVISLKVQNLNTIVKSLLPLIQADAMRGSKCITVELAVIPDLPLDEREMRQLILNLVRNGLEAMPISGNITIKTFTQDKEIILLIQDQGCGIGSDVLEKVGTPFFTTKENGTGLGLAVCYGIAARHNAKIEIETSPNGTKVFVRFKL